MSARSWTLVIPVSVWLNVNQRRHGKAVAVYVKQLREDARTYARAARLPGLGRAHILAVLQFRDNRRRDAANYHPTVKPLVDGLVDHGLLPDDSHTYLDGPDLRIGEPLPPVRFGPVGKVTLIIREA